MKSKIQNALKQQSDCSCIDHNSTCWSRSHDFATLPLGANDAAAYRISWFPVKYRDVYAFLADALHWMLLEMKSDWRSCWRDKKHNILYTDLIDYRVHLWTLCTGDIIIRDRAIKLLRICLLWQFCLSGNRCWRMSKFKLHCLAVFNGFVRIAETRQ